MHLIHKPAATFLNPYWRQDAIFSGLKMFIPFLEGDSLVTKDIRSGNSVPLNGTAWDKSEVGPSILFAADEWIDCEVDSSAYDLTQTTFVLWAATTSSSAANRWLQYLFVDGSNFIKFGIQSEDWSFEGSLGGNYRAWTQTNTNYNDGAMHMYVLSCSTLGVYGYYDGVETDNQAAGGAGTWNTEPFYIGADGSDGWIGTMGGVAHWDRALSASDVAELYRRGPSMGLEGNQELDMSFYGAINGAGSAFNAAFAANSNQVM